MSTTTLRSRLVSLTPVQTYLLAIAGFALVLTSPFTIGHLFVWIGILFEHGWDVGSEVIVYLSTQYTTFNWPATHPGISWTATAFVGFNLYVIAGLSAQHYKKVFASNTHTWCVVGLFLYVAALNQLMFWELPDMSTISQALTTAGGVPDWLVGMVSLLVFLLASGPFAILGLAVLVAVCACIGILL